MCGIIWIIFGIFAVISMILPDTKTLGKNGYKFKGEK